MRQALLPVLCASVLLGCADHPVNPPAFVIDRPEKVIEGLARAYQARDPASFLELLANDSRGNAAFRFIPSSHREPREPDWGYDTEARIHRRMFRPRNPLPGELPVFEALWVEAINISVTRQSEWEERTDLYSDDSLADGVLDRNRWRATGARYATDVFFQMKGEIDSQVSGESDFVVEDLTKTPGDAGKFLLLVWEDRGSPGPKPTGVESNSWTGVKLLYR